RPQGGRAHHRGLILPRRRGDRARPLARAAQGLLRRRKRSGRPHQRRFLQVRPSRRGTCQGRAQAERAAARLRALQACRLLRRDPVQPRLRLDEGPRHERRPEPARRPGGGLSADRCACAPLPLVGRWSGVGVAVHGEVVAKQLRPPTLTLPHKGGGNSPNKRRRRRNQITMDALTKPKRKSLPGINARTYPDLHDHIRAIDEAGLLIRVERPINKDTEMHPLVRWQFRGGIAEKDRKAFLFTNVHDAKGRKHDIPVVIGALAANREIYRLGMGCDLDKINETWNHAIAHPIPPKLVDNAPCQEIVVTGDELDKPGKGLDGIPVPISTPGWDISPYVTLSQYISKDPDSGVQNMGIYRGQVKAPRRLGMNPSLELRPGIYTHWEKQRARGKKLEAAVILGCPPCVAFTSAQKLPETLDELHVAGGLVGAP